MSRNYARERAQDYSRFTDLKGRVNQLRVNLVAAMVRPSFDGADLSGWLFDPELLRKMREAANLSDRGYSSTCWYPTYRPNVRLSVGWRKLGIIPPKTNFAMSHKVPEEVINDLIHQLAPLHEGYVATNAAVRRLADTTMSLANALYHMPTLAGLVKSDDRKPRPYRGSLGDMVEPMRTANAWIASAIIAPKFELSPENVSFSVGYSDMEYHFA